MVDKRDASDPEERGDYETPHDAGPLSHEASFQGPATRPGSVTLLAGVFSLATVLLFVGAIASFLGAFPLSLEATWGLGLLILTMFIAAVAFGLWVGREWGWYAAAGTGLLLAVVGVGGILEGAILAGVGAIALAALLGLVLALPSVRFWFDVGAYGYYDQPTE